MTSSDNAMVGRVSETTADGEVSEYEMYVARNRVALLARGGRGFILVDSSPGSTEVFDGDLRRLRFENPIVYTEPDWRYFVERRLWPAIDSPDRIVSIDKDLGLLILDRHELSGECRELTNILVGEMAEASEICERLRNVDRHTVASPLGQCRIMLRADGSVESAHWTVVASGVSVYEELDVNGTRKEVEERCRALASKCIWVDHLAVPIHQATYPPRDD